jgi:hypothetical protein
MTNRDASTSISDPDLELRPREQRTVRGTYQRLRMVGLTASEAGNLTAHLNGLHVSENGWTLQEIERLLFVRALVDLGRIPI